MISKMIRYDIVLYAQEQERFVEELRELGLVDITTSGWEPSENDRALLLDIEAYNKSHIKDDDGVCDHGDGIRSV